MTSSIPSSLTIKEDKTVDFNWVGEDDHDVYKQIGPGNELSPLEYRTVGRPVRPLSHKFRKPASTCSPALFTRKCSWT